jgi:DNA-binding PucR family transcriptional regulator
MTVPLYQAKAEMFRNLGHPVRIRVLELLQAGPRPVSDLRAEIDVEPSNLSQQLAVLRRAGIVVSYRSDGLVMYALSTPAVADLLAAGESAAAAVAGLMAAPAWPDAPRPVQADDLLPERALAGDDLARERLVQEIYRPLQSTGTALVETLSAFLEQTSSLEATARVLFVHPNTVRYRLRRVTEVCGYAPADPRQALTLRMALALGRLADARLAAPGVL